MLKTCPFYLHWPQNNWRLPVTLVVPVWIQRICPGWLCMSQPYDCFKVQTSLSVIFQTPVFTLFFDGGLLAHSRAKSSVGTTNIPCPQASKCQQRYHTGKAPTFLGFRLRPRQAGFIWKHTKPMLAVAMSTWLAALRRLERRAGAGENKKKRQLTEGAPEVKSEWQTKTASTPAYTHAHTWPALNT